MRPVCIAYFFAEALYSQQSRSESGGDLGVPLGGGCATVGFTYAGTYADLRVTYAKFSGRHVLVEDGEPRKL